VSTSKGPAEGQRVARAPDPLLEWIDWGYELPKRETVYIPILSPSPGAPVRCVCLSDGLTSVATHWLTNPNWPQVRGEPPGVTVPCVGLAHGCAGCLNVPPRSVRWKGYLAGWWAERGRLVLVELTAGAVRAAGGELLGRRDLRGKVVTVKREGYTRQSRATVEIRPSGLAEGDYPPAFDVRAALLRVWAREGVLRPAAGGPPGRGDNGNGQ